MFSIGVYCVYACLRRSCGCKSVLMEPLLSMDILHVCRTWLAYLVRLNVCCGVKTSTSWVDGWHSWSTSWEEWTFIIVSKSLFVNFSSTSECKTTRATVSSSLHYTLHCHTARCHCKPSLLHTTSPARMDQQYHDLPGPHVALLIAQCNSEVLVPPHMWKCELRLT
jgi:hypothetical protein